MQGPDSRDDGEYEHTQAGYLVIAAVTAVILIIIVSAIIFGPVWVVLPVAIVMVLILAMFSTLTVSVRKDTLSLAFGPVRLFRRSWPLSGIATVTIVKNPWYYGWGIRWTPRGPLYNISGFYAVEVTLVSGKVFRIGTDEPGELKRAIGNAARG
ncbi:MAG: hypothetical protein QHH04_03505 [Methanolinea sp.]|nr:hypothetical protein [Methanolinea sp.]